MEGVLYGYAVPDSVILDIALYGRSYYWAEGRAREAALEGSADAFFRCVGETFNSAPGSNKGRRFKKEGLEVYCDGRRK